MSDTHRHYLSDLGLLLREHAEEARVAANASAGTDDYSFQSGRLIAYVEVLSLLHSQAVAFQIPAEQLHLDGFDPARDLLAAPAATDRDP